LTQQGTDMPNLQWIHVLRNSSNCSNFAHDVLDLIVNEMLVVPSEKRKRSSSADLCPKFQSILDKCMAGVGGEMYCTRGVPRPMPSIRLPSGVWITPSRLNTEAKEELDVLGEERETETYTDDPGLPLFQEPEPI